MRPERRGDNLRERLTKARMANGKWQMANDTRTQIVRAYDMIDCILEHLEQVRSELKGLQIGELPSVPIRGWEDLGLPDATTAVYFLVSRSQGLVYIGRATNLRSRWAPLPFDLMNDFPAHHKRRPAIMLGDVTLHWWTVPRESLALIESMLLQIHRPLWNTARG